MMDELVEFDQKIAVNFLLMHDRGPSICKDSINLSLNFPKINNRKNRTTLSSVPMIKPQFTDEIND